MIWKGQTQLTCIKKLRGNVTDMTVVLPGNEVPVEFEAAVLAMPKGASKVVVEVNRPIKNYSKETH